MGTTKSSSFFVGPKCEYLCKHLQRDTVSSTLGPSNFCGTQFNTCHKVCREHMQSSTLYHANNYVLFFVGPECEYRTRCEEYKSSTLGPNQKILFLWGPHVDTKQNSRYASTEIFNFVTHHFFVGPKIEYFWSDVQGMFQIFNLDPTKYDIFCSKKKVKTFDNICK